MDSLRCNVADLLHKPASRRAVHVEADAAELGGVGETRLEAATPVVVDATLEHVPDGIVVQGRVSATAVASCSRCLEDVHLPLTVPVRELYELRPLEGQTYPLEGEELDLELVVRDTLLLELPTAPVCREDCRGLCPVCGANRNETDCACDDSQHDPRWDALSALKFS